MRYVDETGRTMREHTWTCPSCKNAVSTGLVHKIGGPPMPSDIPITCPYCLTFIGLANPSAGGAAVETHAVEPVPAAEAEASEAETDSPDATSDPHNQVG